MFSHCHLYSVVLGVFSELTLVLLEDLEEGVNVSLLGILLGHALVLVPSLPLVLASQVCCWSQESAGKVGQ